MIMTRINKVSNKQKKIEHRNDIHAEKCNHPIWFAPCFDCSFRDGCCGECKRFKTWSRHLKN